MPNIYELNNYVQVISGYLKAKEKQKKEKKMQDMLQKAQDEGYVPLPTGQGGYTFQKKDTFREGYLAAQAEAARALAEQRRAETERMGQPIVIPKVGSGEKITKKFGKYGEFTGATISPKEAPFTQNKIQSVLGDLESGGASTIYGEVIPFDNREQAINHALRNLGPNWETIAPSAKEIINRKWPTKSSEVQYSCPQAPTASLGNIRTQYNRLRSEGVSAEEAKRRLGIK